MIGRGGDNRRTQIPHDPANRICQPGKRLEPKQADADQLADAFGVQRHERIGLQDPLTV
jgi:hypothetical protein